MDYISVFFKRATVLWLQLILTQENRLLTLGIYIYIYIIYAVKYIWNWYCSAVVDESVEWSS